MPEFRGYELRTAREQAGLRLWQVAQEIHTSESCIRRWEGERKGVARNDAVPQHRARR